MPCDFIAIGSVCISQTQGTSGALVAGLTSVIVTLVKICYDFGAERRLSKFRNDEQARREAFEKSERENREAYEKAEALKREKFHRDLSAESDAREAALKIEIDNQIRLKNWKDQRREERLEHLRNIENYLLETYGSVKDLVDEGPSYGDLKMISATALALQKFSTLSKSLSGFSLGNPFDEMGAEIADHVTKIFLTLSPSQEIRKSDERIEALATLMQDFELMKTKFKNTCARFVRDPNIFGDF